MKLTILGATGFLGKALVKEALCRGHRVRVLVRSPEKLGSLARRVEIVTGDVFDEQRLEEAVRGADAVLSTVGPPQGEKIDPAEYQQGMETLVRVLCRQSVRRYLHTGGAVHPGGEDEHWSIGRRLLRLLLRLVARPILTAKALEWEVLKDSDLDWTLVRPPRIVDSGIAGHIAASETRLARVRVDVTDLARFMLDQTTESSWIRRAPLVASVPAAA